MMRTLADLWNNWERYNPLTPRGQHPGSKPPKLTHQQRKARRKAETAARRRNRG